MIRNYLGFPRGTSGGELAHRAWQQAVLFGAEFLFGHRAIGLTGWNGNHVIELPDGARVTARCVIVAVGVTYRRLDIPALDRLTGTGVYYGAAGVEATAMAGEHVYVVGGANSAGQAALHLAKFARRVTLLVRGASLAAGMSDYLTTQIDATPDIDVRLGARVVDGHGNGRLESLTIEDVDIGRARGRSGGGSLRPDRRGAAHRVAAGPRSAGQARICAHRSRRLRRGVAAAARALAVRDEPARRAGGGRCPAWIGEARCRSCR